MSTNEIISLILSFLTIAIAVIALFQSSKQTKLSNKQSLFNERVNKFVKLKDLINMYQNSRELLMDAEKMSYLLLQTMTKNTIFLDDNLYKGERLSDAEQIKFSAEMEQLLSLAEEISLLWEKEEFKLASEFVKSYVMLLLDLFKQHYLIFNSKKGGYDQRALNILTKNLNLQQRIAQVDEIWQKINETNMLNALKDVIKLK